MRVNRQIRVPRVRLIDETGKQIGIIATHEALERAERSNLDLVEIAPLAEPPVCKIIDYGKYRYQQTKKEKENRKGSVQGKLKEVKMKPNIDKHDLETKMRRAKEFLEKGNKVKFSCMFRGREIMFSAKGKVMFDVILTELDDYSSVDAPPKMMGNTLSMILSPAAKDKKKKEKKSDQGKEQQSAQEEV
ncbi:MAG: translation initiation factor IF-3 [Chlamydiae bacterium RIFCSPHIGHO2_12_FULL_49_11]|nr:MAG: translation initiation factor IF-3 [Chlamydiae bacterium RIFCSPHIGHO2_12_FULL_49_11]